MAEPSGEEKFRESLRDLLVIVKRLGPHCADVGELVGILEHALENPAQLRLLVSKL